MQSYVRARENIVLAVGVSGFLGLVTAVTGWHGITRTVLGAIVFVWFVSAVVVWLLAWQRDR
jgi:hypothetical protein